MAAKNSEGALDKLNAELVTLRNRNQELEQENARLKDSIINRGFIGYANKYDTWIFTFDRDMNPLYNTEPGSFDTLNTIFRNQSKPTNIADLRYFERSFDKFSYIFKKDVIDTNEVPGTWTCTPL